MAKYKVTVTTNDFTEAIKHVIDAWGTDVESVDVKELNDDSDENKDARAVLETTLPALREVADTLNKVGGYAIDIFSTIDSFRVQMDEDAFFRAFNCFAVEERDGESRTAYVKICGVKVFTITTEEKIDEQF